MEQQQQHRKVAAGGLAAAAVLGLGAVAGAAAGVGPFERSVASDDVAATVATGVTTPTTPDSAPDGDVINRDETRVAGDGIETRTFVSVPEGDTQTFAAGPAGFVTIGQSGGALRIVAIAPTAGFAVSEQGVEDGGREVEVRFVAGGATIRFDAELEDGQVRIRVRQRGLGATAATTPTTLDDDGRGGREGPGRGDDDGTDDHSGPGGGSDDSSGPGGGDHDSSGSGSGGGGSGPG